MLNKNKKAFSLIEAMIILMLISIAVMMLIPLISQKTTFPAWHRISDKLNTTLTYGTSKAERVGIGVNPYDTTTQAKLAVSSVAISTNSAASSLQWGSKYTNSTFSCNTSLADSIMFGMTTSDISTANLLYLSSPNGSTVSSGDIVIGNNGIKVTGGKTFIYNGNNNIIIELDDNSFSFNNSDGTSFMSYKDGTLTIADKLNLGSKILYLNPDVESYSSDTNNSSYGSCKQYFYGINDDETVNGKTYCDEAWKRWGYPTTDSDRRLKNILYDYDKGIDEINKVQTYRFTYKNDKDKKNLVGIIAQKLTGIFDEALHKDEKGYYSYEREPLFYAMINSVKSIFKIQQETEAKQIKANKKADKLIRMYE